MAKESFDRVILDVMLPNIDGFQLLERNVIRQSRSGLAKNKQWPDGSSDWRYRSVHRQTNGNVLR
mgnify:CR=1 FL=1